MSESWNVNRLSGAGAPLVLAPDGLLLARFYGSRGGTTLAADAQLAGQFYGSPGGGIVLYTITTGRVLGGTYGQVTFDSTGLPSSGTTVCQLPYGGTGSDMSATGGSGQYVKQGSAGGNLTAGTIPGGDLPVFLPAGGGGGSNVKGAVPAPGATTHTNHPYLLGDDAAFKKPLGKLLGALFVSSDESTTSTTLVDLTTADSVTFTLDVTSDVLIEYTANTYNSNASTNNTNEVVIDGSAEATSRTDHFMGSANAGTASVCDYTKASLSAASHTVKVQHLVSANTGHWRERTLRVWLLA